MRALIAIALLVWLHAGAAAAQKDAQARASANQDWSGDFGPLNLAGAPTLTSLSNVQRGDILLTVPARPARTARLTSDVRIWTVGFGGVQYPTVLPAGTPVYGTAFQQSNVVMGIAQPVGWVGAWCGVITNERGRRRGYCVTEPTGVAGMYARGAVGEIHRGADFFALTISPSGPPAEIVAVDETADTGGAFPLLDLVFTFRGFDSDGARIEVGLREHGGAVEEVDQITFPIEADGSARVVVAGVEVRLRRGGNRRSAFVEAPVPSSP